MTREEAIEKLKQAINGNNPETDHRIADQVLCEFLTALGFADVVEEYNKVHKWYA
jgi:hypothetical protein